MDEGSAGATVLVVDDEREVADAYALKLRERYEVRTAYSGQEALAVVDDAVDVVLLDRRMPEMTGDEVLATLRDRDVDVRVLLLTAIDPDFDIIGMPFDDYICKPIPEGDLVEAVEQQLRIRAYERLGQYFRLEAKRAVLRSQLPQVDLEDHEEYTELAGRTAELREQVSRTVPEFEMLAERFDAIGREM